MIRTHIRGVVTETKLRLIFYDGEEREVRIEDPRILEVVDGEERPYTVGLNDFDVIRL